jgi:hypothetical protein
MTIPEYEDHFGNNTEARRTLPRMNLVSVCE